MKITQKELQEMVRESVRRKLKEKLTLGEAVNVRAGTDIILAAEKEWHDFVYNVIAKQLGLVSVEKMPDDLGNKILSVIKSEWPKIRDAVSSTAEKLSGFPKDGESNSVTNIQNPGMVAEQLKPKEFPGAKKRQKKLKVSKSQLEEMIKHVIQEKKKAKS